MRNEQDRFQTSGGIELFEQAWLPDGPAKAVVCIVHGYAEHSGRYEHVGRNLASHGYAVCALDLRGHGRSQGTPVLVRSFNEYLDDVERFLGRVRARHGHSPLFLLGHSMGGTIVALSLVTRRPDVRGVILSGASLNPPSGPGRVVAELFLLLARVAPGLRLTTLDAATVSRDPDVVARYDSDPLVYRGKVPLGTMAAMLRVIRLIRKRMATIAVPLLILHGSEDQLTDPEGSRFLHEHAASVDKTLKIYEGLYHEILNEPEQDQVLEEIVSWLDIHAVAVSPVGGASPAKL